MVKQLLKSVREFKKDALLTPFFVVLEVVMEVLIPFVMAELIDKGIDAQNMSAIGKYGFILVACAMLALVFGAAAGTYAARASTGFARNLRHDMYYAVQDFSFSNIDKFSTGSIVTRLTTDVTNVQNAFQMCTRIAVRCPVMLIFAFVMAAKINRNMALIFVAVLPVLAIGLGILMKMVGPVFERVFKIYDRLNTVVQENVHGIRVVKAYVREDHEAEKFENVSELLYRTFSKAHKTLACNMPLMQFCMYACMLLVSWFGARLIVSGSMTTGELTSMFSYIMQILMSLMMVAMVFVMITMAKASAERVAELLSEKPDLHNPAQPVCEVKDGSIDFDAVDFSYKGDEHKLALRDVNLHIYSGQTIGILGGTGSAKSTLVQLIPRLYDVTRGSVKVGGVDVRDYDIETLRDEVAMVLQKNVLFSGTIKENLRWGNENASDDELVRVCRLAQADEFIQQMPDKYDTHIEQGGSNVSGGQKQRLCIARALLKKPKILILDDSTSAVDTKTDALIRRAFAEEIPNTTKIIIAQRVSSCRRPTRSLSLTAARCRRSARTTSCSQIIEFIRKSTTSRTERAVRNNGRTSDARSRRPQTDGRKAQQKSEKNAEPSDEIYRQGLRHSVWRGSDLHCAVGRRERCRFDVPQEPDRRLCRAAAPAGVSRVHAAYPRADGHGGHLFHRHRHDLPL